jgi:hypothetical protein
MSQVSQLENRPSRPRDTDRRTRIHLSFYDRIKFLLLFAITFLVLTWSSLAENPILSVEDGLRNTANSKSWLIVLAVIEVIRQIHFILAEVLAPYHGVWKRYFDFVDRQIQRLNGPLLSYSLQSFSVQFMTNLLSRRSFWRLRHSSLLCHFWHSSCLLLSLSLFNL